VDNAQKKGGESAELFTFISLNFSSGSGSAPHKPPLIRFGSFLAVEGEAVKLSLKNIPGIPREGILLAAAGET
jgi:hypothetical protein